MKGFIALLVKKNNYAWWKINVFKLRITYINVIFVKFLVIKLIFIPFQNQITYKTHLFFPKNVQLESNSF